MSPAVKAVLALTGQPNPPGEIGEETKVSIKLILACAALLLTLIGTIWGFHTAAIRTITERQAEVLKNYPTWRDLQALRDDDRKFFIEEFRSLREDIRRSK